MSSSERFYVIITLLSLFVFPGIIILMRLTARWTKVEAIVDGIKDIMAEQDKIHGEMLRQMSEDRHATNTRLEYLERLWMERGLGRTPR